MLLSSKSWLCFLTAVVVVAIVFQPTQISCSPQGTYTSDNVDDYDIPLPVMPQPEENGGVGSINGAPANDCEDGQTQVNGRCENAATIFK
ncbi:unnamed protein product [Allacma fusca]|uniref:Salivary secreted peptide n=1 Tax=Allacma fusca TaxID=39272 RepID=A0A8J2J5F7_9HEXA|nr:unnamed protein product [Allacma fusca]